MPSVVVAATMCGSEVVSLPRRQRKGGVGRLVVRVCEVAVASEATDMSRCMGANGAGRTLRTVGVVVGICRELHAALAAKAAAVVCVAEPAHSTATLVCNAVLGGYTRCARVVTLPSLLLRRIGLIHKGLVGVGSADLINSTGDTSFEEVGLGGGFG